jgi:hypothetical protein
VGYIDAGCVVVLGLLAAYAATLGWRRQRLERAARRVSGDAGPDAA